MKKVTIGLCVKNNEKTVGATVKSILAQDYPRELMELVIVDGMSQDATMPIIKSLIKQSDLQTKIFSDHGGGLGLARQIIVDNAESEYIAWIDGDIIIPKNFLKPQVDFLDKDPLVGAVQASRWNYEGRSLSGTLEIMSGLHNSSGCKRRFLPTRGAIYRVKAIRDVDGFDKDIKGAAEDIDLSFRLWQRGWRLYINEGTWIHVARESWKDLWDQYWWYGYGSHFIGHKHKDLIVLWPWIPPVSLLAGWKSSLFVYKLTNRKLAFLLPLNYLYKKLAWILGHIKSHFDEYGHFNRSVAHAS